jgi:hypothetical protein
MTTLIQQIEEMRVRMNELASSEHGLVRALGDALSRADQKLLQEVRNLTTEHEVRRGEILNELQNLASRMGALPRPRRPVVPALEEVPIDVAVAMQEPTQPALRGGDWRRATANIQEELAARFNGRAAAG